MPRRDLLFGIARQIGEIQHATQVRGVMRMDRAVLHPATNAPLSLTIGEDGHDVAAIEPELPDRLVSVGGVGPRSSYVGLQGDAGEPRVATHVTRHVAQTNRPKTTCLRQKTKNLDRSEKHGNTSCENCGAGASCPKRCTLSTEKRLLTFGQLCTIVVP